MAYVSDLRVSGASWFSQIADLRTRFAAARARHAVYHETLRELNSLSKRELADVGISQFQIKRIAREAADAAV